MWSLGRSVLISCGRWPVGVFLTRLPLGLCLSIAGDLSPVASSFAESYGGLVGEGGSRRSYF